MVLTYNIDMGREKPKIGHFGHKKLHQIKAAQKLQQLLLKTCYPTYLEGFRTKTKNVPFF